MEDKRIELLNAELEKDATLAEKLAACKSPEELQKELNTIGVELNDEEANATYDQLKNPQSEEISEADLDNVAGGSIKTVIGALVAQAIMRFNPNPIPTLPRRRW